MSLNPWAWYETFLAAKGLFRSGQPAVHTPSAPPEAPLKQQKPGFLPSRDDEAILIALDAGIYKLPNGLAHLRRIGSVSAKLRPDQRRDWRLNLTSLSLTEKFETVRETEVIARGGNKQTPTVRDGLGQIKRTYGRRPRDYEFGPEDPRIEHLLLISTLVETGGANGIQDAVDYLLQRDFIKAKSVSMELSDTKEAAAQAAFLGMASLQLGDAYDVIMAHPAPGVDQEQVLGRALNQKLQAKKAAHADRKAAGLPAWFWKIIIVGSIVALLGIVALRFL